MNIIHVYYNRDAFQEVGLADPNDLYAKGQWTWAAILNAGQKLTKGSGAAIDRYGYDADIDIFRATAFVTENGGTFFDEAQKRFVFAEQQAALDAVQWLVDLNLKYRLPAPNDVEKQFGYTVGLFAKGKSAMFHGWASYLAGMVPTIGKAFRFGVAPMPTGKQEATFDNGGFTSIMQATKKPEASWAFAKYANGIDAYRILLQNDFIVLPVLKDPQAKDAFAKLPVFGASNLVKHAQRAVTANYVTPQISDIWGAFGKVAGDIWSGKAAVRTGLTTAQQQMQTLYDGSK